MSKKGVREIIKGCGGIGVLATLDGTTPRVRPMTCVITRDFAVWTATHAGGRKAKQIETHRRVEFLFATPGWRAHVRLSGRAVLVKDRKKRASYYRKAPHLKKYFSSPDDANYVMIELKPSLVEIMPAGSMTYDRVKV